MFEKKDSTFFEKLFEQKPSELFAEKGRINADDMKPTKERLDSDWQRAKKWADELLVEKEKTTPFASTEERNIAGGHLIANFMEQAIVAPLSANYGSIAEPSLTVLGHIGTAISRLEANPLALDGAAADHTKDKAQGDDKADAYLAIAQAEGAMNELQKEIQQVKLAFEAAGEPYPGSLDELNSAVDGLRTEIDHIKIMISGGTFTASDIREKIANIRTAAGKVEESVHAAQASLITDIVDIMSTVLGDAVSAREAVSWENYRARNQDLFIAAAKSWADGPAAWTKAQDARDKIIGDFIKINPQAYEKERANAAPRVDAIIQAIPKAVRPHVEHSFKRSFEDILSEAIKGRFHPMMEDQAFREHMFKQILTDAETVKAILVKEGIATDLAGAQAIVDKFKDPNYWDKLQAARKAQAETPDALTAEQKEILNTGKAFERAGKVFAEHNKDRTLAQVYAEANPGMSAEALHEKIKELEAKGVPVHAKIGDVLKTFDTIASSAQSQDFQKLLMKETGAKSPAELIELLSTPAGLKQAQAASLKYAEQTIAALDKFPPEKVKVAVAAEVTAITAAAQSTDPVVAEKAKVVVEKAREEVAQTIAVAGERAVSQLDQSLLKTVVISRNAELDRVMKLASSHEGGDPQIRTLFSGLALTQLRDKETVGYVEQQLKANGGTNLIGAPGDTRSFQERLGEAARVYASATPEEIAKAKINVSGGLATDRDRQGGASARDVQLVLADQAYHLIQAKFLKDAEAKGLEATIRERYKELVDSPEKYGLTPDQLADHFKSLGMQVPPKGVDADKFLNENMAKLKDAAPAMFLGSEIKRLIAEGKKPGSGELGAALYAHLRKIEHVKDLDFLAGSLLESADTTTLSEESRVAFKSAVDAARKAEELAKQNPGNVALVADAARLKESALHLGALTMVGAIQGELEKSPEKFFASQASFNDTAMGFASMYDKARNAAISKLGVAVTPQGASELDLAKLSKSRLEEYKAAYATALSEEMGALYARDPIKYAALKPVIDANKASLVPEGAPLKDRGLGSPALVAAGSRADVASAALLTDITGKPDPFMESLNAEIAVKDVEIKRLQDVQVKSAHSVEDLRARDVKWGQAVDNIKSGEISTGVAIATTVITKAAGDWWQNRRTISQIWNRERNAAADELNSAGAMTKEMAEEIIKQQRLTKEARAEFDKDPQRFLSAKPNSPDAKSLDLVRTDMIREEVSRIRPQGWFSAVNLSDTELDALRTKAAPVIDAKLAAMSIGMPLKPEPLSPLENAWIRQRVKDSGVDISARIEEVKDLPQLSALVRAARSGDQATHLAAEPSGSVFWGSAPPDTAQAKLSAAEGRVKQLEDAKKGYAGAVVKSLGLPADRMTELQLTLGETKGDAAAIVQVRAQLQRALKLNDQLEVNNEVIKATLDAAAKTLVESAAKINQQLGVAKTELASRQAQVTLEKDPTKLLLATKDDKGLAPAEQAAAREAKDLVMQARERTIADKMAKSAPTLMPWQSAEAPDQLDARLKKVTAEVDKDLADKLAKASLPKGQSAVDLVTQIEAQNRLSAMIKDQNQQSPGKFKPPVELSEAERSAQQAIQKQLAAFKEPATLKAAQEAAERVREALLSKDNPKPKIDPLDAALADRLAYQKAATAAAAALNKNAPDYYQQVAKSAAEVEAQRQAGRAALVEFNKAPEQTVKLARTPETGLSPDKLAEAKRAGELVDRAKQEMIRQTVEREVAQRGAGRSPAEIAKISAEAKASVEAQFSKLQQNAQGPTVSMTHQFAALLPANWGGFNMAAANGLSKEEEARREKARKEAEAREQATKEAAVKTVVEHTAQVAAVAKVEQKPAGEVKAGAAKVAEHVAPVVAGGMLSTQKHIVGAAPADVAGSKLEAAPHLAMIDNATKSIKGPDGTLHTPVADKGDVARPVAGKTTGGIPGDVLKTAGITEDCAKKIGGCTDAKATLDRVALVVTPKGDPALLAKSGAVKGV